MDAILHQSLALPVSAAEAFAYFVEPERAWTMAFGALREQIGP